MIAPLPATQDPLASLLAAATFTDDVASALHIFWNGSCIVASGWHSGILAQTPQLQDPLIAIVALST